MYPDSSPLIWIQTPFPWGYLQGKKSMQSLVAPYEKLRSFPNSALTEDTPPSSWAGMETLPSIYVRNLLLLLLTALSKNWVLILLTISQFQGNPDIIPVFIIGDVSSPAFCTQCLVIPLPHSPKITPAVKTLKQAFAVSNPWSVFDC